MTVKKLSGKPDVKVVITVDTNDGDYLEFDNNMSFEKFTEDKPYLEILEKAPKYCGIGEVADDDLDMWLTDEFEEAGLTKYTGESFVDKYGLYGGKYGWHSVKSVVVYTSDPTKIQ